MYDRLRKRSYRLADLWENNAIVHVVRYPEEKVIQHEYRDWVHHRAYLQGVRDALNEILS